MRATPKLARGLLIAGIVLIVIGAGVMDEAGRSHQDLWWNVAGAFAFAGFLLSVVSLFLAEGSALLPRRWPEAGKRPGRVPPGGGTAQKHGGGR